MLVDDVPVTPVHAHERPFITFPPFPEPPPGAKIPVWSEFKPAGIEVVLDLDSAELERDGRGIPTARLGSNHSLTAAERMKHKGGKKMKKMTVGSNGSLKRMSWYEEWDELETTRRASIDPALNRIDRLHEAASEFKACRPWPPPIDHNRNPLLLWDYWRHYLGLISQIQSEPKKGKMQKQVEEEDDEEEEEDAAGPEDQTTVTMVDDVEARQRMEDERRPEPQQTELNDEALARRDRWREAREDKKEFFLNDPELAVKLFFSSHWRDKGYVHSERKCEEGPILIAFFLRYLIRNRVFPEEEAKLKRAAALCDLAKIELPATSKVAQALPDEVSKGFEELNGQMTPGMFVIYEPQGDAEDESEPDASEEPDAKKRKIESESDALEKMCEDDPTVEVIDPNAIDHDSPAVHDAIRDNVDQNGDEFEPSARPASPPANTWDTGTWGIGGGDGVSTDWGSSAQAATSWGFDSKNALVEFLGPTVLPFTHTTGIVERSTRKIVQIIRPAGVPAQGTKKTKSLTPTEGVEDELARHFGVVVLAPWVKVGNHVASDIIPPQILPDSRGSVVLPQLSRSERLNYGLVNAPPAPPPPPDGADSPHAAFDPRRDAVRVLAAPATLDTLAPHVGMGVLATWVQIARKDAPADDVQARAPAWGTRKKKGGQSEGAPRPRGAPGKNGAPTQWWYMESTACALTSFHTDRYYADQDE